MIYSYPLDTIKTNVQSGSSTWREMIGNRFWGTRNYRNGMKLTLFGSFAAEATNFTVYENVRIFLLGRSKGMDKL